MAEFYKNLWERKLPKLEALRQAQLAMLNDYRPGSSGFRGGMTKKLDSIARKPALRVRDLSGDDRLPPFYWAAFVLSGDWR